MLSKLKNIAKTLYCRSKSHFSHIYKEVEKPTARPLILKGFWSQNRPKIKKSDSEIVLKNHLNLNMILIADRAWPSTLPSLTAQV